MKVMDHVRHVIQSTVVPSWVEKPPLNYGAAKAGSLKYMQWDKMSHLFLPLSLGTYWSPLSPQQGADIHPNAKEALENVMHLCQACIVASKETTSQHRADRFRHHYRNYLRTLTSEPLNSYNRNLVPYHHILWHIYETLLYFGPLRASWCLPFERFIGKLQRIHDNHKPGKLTGPSSISRLLYSLEAGQFERTTITKLLLVAKVIRWVLRLISRTPKSVQKLSNILKKAYERFLPEGNFDEVSDIFIPPTDQLHIPSSRPTQTPTELEGLIPHKKIVPMSYITLKKHTYSLHGTHEGNSQVMFLPNGEDDAVPGIIKHIFYDGRDHRFAIQRLLHDREYPDLFRPFPDFASRMVKSELSCPLEIVPVDSNVVVSHFAKYKLTKDVDIIIDLTRVNTVHFTLIED
jgi:hypothetical protein